MKEIDNIILDLDGTVYVDNKIINKSDIEIRRLAKKGKSICIVGRDDGYAHKNSDISILVNIANKKLVTPISETFQTLIWHLLVSHPKLQVNKTKW